jgi:hypothetical protein
MQVAFAPKRVDGGELWEKLEPVRLCFVPAQFLKSPRVRLSRTGAEIIVREGDINGGFEK